MARALVEGARRELDLTPKPGLVDRWDNGSHPDLSYEQMQRSIDLLPVYFEELLAIGGASDLAAAIRAGQAAEARMLRATGGTNTHKGYIFLSGLTLLAGSRDFHISSLPVSAILRPAIARIAHAFFETADPRRGEEGGIRSEALAGLPCVFEIGLPAYEERLRRNADETVAAFELMGRLMIHLDDTTARRRCGPEGNAILRADGARLLEIVDAGVDPRPFLVERNEEYRRMRLTMGGVADCMAICFALHRM
ncbi:MAG: triphosphoribosyl-dephospho-CoA synthase [Candidatus Eisenbacteria bacterium]